MIVMVSTVISVPFMPLLRVTSSQVSLVISGLLVEFGATRMFSPLPSMHDEAAIHRDRLPGYVACGITAKPQNSISNFLGAANPSHGHALLHCLEGLTLAGRDHLVGHRCPNKPRTYSIDSDAPCSVFESRALGEPDYSVLGRMVDPTLGPSDKSPKRRAIDNGSTSLFAHLLQLELHATPYTAEVDPHHPVVIFPGRISRLC